MEGSRCRRAPLQDDPWLWERHGPHLLGIVLAAWDPAAAAESVDLVLGRFRRLSGVKCSIVVVANNDDVLVHLGLKRRRVQRYSWLELRSRVLGL